MLKEAVDKTVKEANKVTGKKQMKISAEEVGKVVSITGSIIEASGLTGVQSEELVSIGEKEIKGLAYNLNEDDVGIVLLGEPEGIKAGDKIVRTGRIADIPVGEEMLGRVVDPLGNPLDDNGVIKGSERFRIEREAHPIMHRKPVSVPMQTGIKAIDSIIQIGRGQRELILGDRQTGKTAIAIDTMINQKDTDVICIYCAIGQRASSVTRVIQSLKEHGVMDKCIIVNAAGESSPGLQFLAPYSATSIGEYFMEKMGKDVLVIYDNLTVHAEAYRQMSLYLRRPPGREAFPGDIFYIHSRLLERSTRLLPEFGGGSLTALPICETLAENVSSYIPTNLISITDGQIFLSNTLMHKGVMPAIDIGISVSRVGNKAQLPAYKAVAGALKMTYSQFEELEAFAKFGTQLDEETRNALTRGERVREILKQKQFRPLKASEQVIVILATTAGLFDQVPIKEISDTEEKLLERAKKELKNEMKEIASGEKLKDDKKKELAKKIASIIKDLGYDVKIDLEK